MSSYKKIYPSYLLFIIISFAATSHAFAQNLKVIIKSSEVTVRGRVIDASDQSPMTGVNVYIDKTTIGATTDKDGYYSFTTSLSGAHSLVFSFIGYEKQAYALQLGMNGEKIVLVNARLEIKIYEPGEITVTGDNREWRRNYAQFRRLFIGNSDFADSTYIENFTVVEFYDAGWRKLNAFSKEPLIVLNKALGYRIIVDLEGFEWNLRNKTGSFFTYLRFEELEPRNSTERETWDKNREKAYKGSLRHFLYSYYHNRVDSEGFKYKSKRFLKPASEYQLTIYKEELGIAENSDYAFYRLARPILITYDGNLFQGRRSFFNSRIDEKNWLEPVRGKKFIGIDEYGNLYDPLSIQISGTWSFNRIGDQLPFDYTYPQD